MNKIVIFQDYKIQKDEKDKKNLRQKYQEEDDSGNGFGIDFSDFDSPEMQEFIKEQEEYGEFEAFYEQKYYKEIQKEYEIWRKEHGYE